MEYPTDLLLTEDLDISIDAANDIATISGQQQLEQSVALDVMDETINFVGDRLTGEKIGLLEERIRQSLAADEQIADVRSVNIVEYNQESGTITADVLVVDDEDFTITIPT
jgi:mannose/fructose/N-acetylgalactosamine-specific phosphotransferase system component IIB